MTPRWAAIAGAVLFATAAWAQSGAEKYHAAKVAQASDIPYPLNTHTPGFVTLNAIVDSSGTLQNTLVIRDVPPLTDAVQNSVKNWQFSPATENGQAVNGVVQVNVAFNPFNPSGVGLPGAPLQPPDSNGGGKFQPAGLQTASYATYPPNTVAYGTVVLQLHVGSDGKVHKVAPIGGKAELSTPSIAAAKTWTFSPATYKGKAIGSDVVVVFVFAPPQAGTQ
jgi:Gram-negative bacterial TonB protein C-terminal